MELVEYERRIQSVLVWMRMLARDMVQLSEYPSLGQTEDVEKSLRNNANQLIELYFESLQRYFPA